MGESCDRIQGDFAKGFCMKKFLITLLMLLFALWFFFPATILLGKEDEVLMIHSPDKEFNAVIYQVPVISPFSFYKWLRNEDYYFIVFDRGGNVIFKPSVFYGASSLAAGDATQFLYGDRRYFYYPGVDGYESVALK